MTDATSESAPSVWVDLQRSFDTLLTGWRSGATILGERLTLAQDAATLVEGALATAVATDRHGAPVVVIATPVVSTDTIIDLARVLASLERARPEGNRGSAGRAIVVCEKSPSPRAWNALSAQLGFRLGGVYGARRMGVEMLHPPSNWSKLLWRVRPEWTITEWLAAVGVVIGLVLTAVGVRGLLAG